MECRRLDENGKKVEEDAGVVYIGPGRSDVAERWEVAGEVGEVERGVGFELNPAFRLRLGSGRRLRTSGRDEGGGVHGGARAGGGGCSVAAAEVGDGPDGGPPVVTRRRRSDGASGPRLEPP